MRRREFLTQGKKAYIREKIQSSSRKQAEIIYLRYCFLYQFNPEKNISERQEYLNCILEMADKFATEKFWYELDKKQFNADTGWFLIRLIRREPEPKPNGGRP